MWTRGWRDRAWEGMGEEHDLVVVGGGITGAAVLREATRAGLRALLVEQRDFAWGTSSRSSKLVHGGFRYLAQGRIGLVRHAVRQRRRLLEERLGPVTPVGFMLASYRGDRPPAWVNRLAVALYDLLAGVWDHRWMPASEVRETAPHLEREGLERGARCVEGQADDARMVLRLLLEAAAAGGAALSYAPATGLLRQGERVVGVRVRDALRGREAEVRARAVVDATGAWAGSLLPGSAPRLRPLRGSHLVLPAARLPVTQAIAFRHPVDGRYVNVAPWEGVTLAGTTDLDHRRPLSEEPAISPEEADYLMAGLRARFPSLGLTLADAVASFSGVRPVVDAGEGDPSRAGRDHFVAGAHGLVTAAGGKLTTFRLLAREALRAARPPLPLPAGREAEGPAFDDPGPLRGQVGPALRERLLRRYGAAAQRLVDAAAPGELETVPGAVACWAELRWAARAEGVVHLEDLLLRRVRLGLCLPEGGAEHLPRVRALCQAELGWDDARWEAEEAAYRELWRRCYAVPVAGGRADG